MITNSYLKFLKNIILKHSFIKVITFYFILFSGFNTFSQIKKQKELEAKRTRLQQEIKKINTLLFNTKKEEKNILSQIDNLGYKIKTRAKLIEVIEQEANILNSKIQSNLNNIKYLEKELRLLKQDYALIIYKSYKSKSMQSRILFILSSKDFYQAYKRIQYMNQYANFRKKQGKEIAVKTEKIKERNNQIKVQKIEKENILSEKKEEQSIIEFEKKNQEILIAKVKSKEEKYRIEIRQKQEEERKIDLQIEKLIRKAIYASKKKNKNTPKGFSLTPETKLLASKFELNKGKLPWPVVNALIVRDFGKIPHETLKGIIIQSNGIRIATDKGANAMAIFEGTVLAIQVDSKGIKTIMIQHGNYISLYGNLETVTVQKGNKIPLRQNLGKIHTDKVTSKTILKFQIWKDTQKQNPKYWLARI